MHGTVTIDPQVHGLIGMALALLLGSAAAHKLREPQRFAAQLAAYRLLPEAVAPLAGRALGALEAFLCLALLLPWTRAAAGPAVALLLALYGGAIAINLLRGRRHIDCGCGDVPVPLSLWLLVRNAVLVAGAAVLALPVSERALGWLDPVLGLPALIAVVLAHLAFEQLLGNHGRLRPAESSHD